MAERRETDRPMPHDLDAERSVLGTILLHNEALHKIVDRLEATDFYRDAHRRLYIAMLLLHEAGTAIDYVVLKQQLERSGDLEEVGGPAYITALVDGVPRSANIGHHADIIREHSRRRKAIAAARRLAQRALEAQDDAVTVVGDAAEELFVLGGVASSARAVPASEIMPAVIARIDRAHQGGDPITGLKTDFTKLDAMLSGFQPADFIVVAARTSIGKTSFLMNIARNVGFAVDVGAVLVHSCEMSREQLMLRLVASEARVEGHRLRSGWLSDQELARVRNATAQLCKSNILIDDSPSVSVLEVRARARAVRSEYGLSMVGIDYLQLMRGRGKFDNRTQEIGTITRGVKALAKELSVPIVVLSQLSRAPETRRGGRPQLSDLRESGDIEQDADTVLFLYRPDKEGDEGNAEVIVAKQRNGPTGSVYLSWQPEYTLFENVAKHEVPA